MVMLISGAVFMLCAMGWLPMLPTNQTLLISGALQISMDDFERVTQTQKILIRRNTVPGVVMTLIGVAILVFAVIKAVT